MRINKLTASFGKLNNDTISFHDGLNVIEAPNESGKSTWCAFIRAMLYGIDSAERSKNGHLADKMKYAPWSGASMEGTMELTSNGRDISISRRTRLKNSPMKEFSASYLGTNIPVDGLTGQNVGEKLCGVSKDVFCKSAFVEQGTTSITSSGDLEKRINSILLSGEENTSFSEAETRLKEWQRKRKFNNSGIIPELEQKIKENKAKVSDINKTNEIIHELELRISDTREECKRLESRMNSEVNTKHDNTINAIEKAQQEAKDIGIIKYETNNKLNSLKDKLIASPFAGESVEIAKDEANKDYSFVEESLRKTYKKPTPILFIMLLLLSAATVAGHFFYYSSEYLLYAGAAFLAFSVLFLIIFLEKCRSRRNLLEKINKILTKYDARKCEDILKKYEHYKQYKSEAAECELEIDSLDRRANIISKELSEYQMKLIGELRSKSDDSITASVVEKRKMLSEDELMLAQEKGRVSFLGDIDRLNEKLNIYQEEKAQTIEEYNAISLALETLKLADSEIQGSFSPKLGQIATKYMSFVTGGKYEDVLLNKDLSAKVKSVNEAVARESSYLSVGTVDLLYLAVRLAICELALPAGETCPLIIDDALVNLDEERYNQAMRLLEEIAKQRQVIVFTCRRT